MRIGIAASDHIMLPCGIARSSIEIIKSLVKIDKDNKYIIFAGDKNAQKILGEETLIKVLPQQLLKLGNLLPEFSYSQFILPIALKKEKIEILHSLFNPLPLTKYCKTIISIHDLIFMKQDPRWAIAPIYARYLTKWLLFSIKHAQKIICPSLFTKSDIIRTIGIPGERIIAIPWGVSNNFSHIEDKDRLTLFKRKYKLPPKFILHVSHIMPRKNLINTIEAFSKIAKNIDHKLVIVGKRDPTTYHKYYKLLDNSIKSLGLKDRVIFFDQISEENLVYMYNAAELFVLPSLYEGFGLPVLEAMACGTPVITSNATSLPEVAQDAAILVDPYNAEELSKSIYRILHDGALRNSLIEKGLERAKSNSLDITAKEIIKVYREVSKSAN